MTKDSPILVRLFKQESELEVWKQDRTGHFELLKTYPICRWSGELGPKVKEGDRQAPEGFYTITPGQMNPNSHYYLAFNMGFPNAFDRAWGRTGAELMVHGDCSSRGCYAMTDEQIGEIYSLARESFFGGQRAFQVQAYPFKMTPANFAKNRNNPNIPFWKELKVGYDHFEVTRTEPKVDVCDKHYVFDAVPASGSGTLNFSPKGACPAYKVSDEIASAVQDKQRQDEFQTAELIRRGTPAAPAKTGVDGGMNPVFLTALQGGNVLRDVDGTVRSIGPVAAAPGTIPAYVSPPHAPEAAETRAETRVVAGSTGSINGPVAVGGPTRVATAGEDTPAAGGKAPENKPPEKQGGMFSNMTSSLSRWVGLGGGEGEKPEAKPAAAKPEPKHKSVVAMRPKPKSERPKAVANATPPKAEAKPRQEAVATPPAAADSSGFNAQPAPPVGTFSGRWGAGQ